MAGNKARMIPEETKVILENDETLYVGIELNLCALMPRRWRALIGEVRQMAKTVDYSDSLSFTLHSRSIRRLQ